MRECLRIKSMIRECLSDAAYTYWVGYGSDIQTDFARRVQQAENEEAEFAKIVAEIEECVTYADRM